MPKIDASINVKRDKDIVYKLLKRFDRFPKFIPDIKNIKILKRVNGTLVTEWDINIDGVNINWSEENRYFDKDAKIEFSMLSGDYNRYKGEWCVDETPMGARLRLSADIDFGAPALMEFTNPIMLRKTKRSFRTLLRAIKKEVERTL